jgi:hypothetical protein
VDFWRIVAALGVPGLALGIFYMLFRGASKQWPISRKWTPLFLALWMVIIGGLVLFALQRYAPERQAGLQVYQVRITVLSPTGLPVEGAKVWSARGGEPKEVPGGWEFEIPATKRPTDGQITFFATKGEQQGATPITLGSEAFVSGTIRLNPPGAVEVREIIQAEPSQAIAGDKVALEGSGAKTILADTKTVPASNTAEV